MGSKRRRFGVVGCCLHRLLVLAGLITIGILDIIITLMTAPFLVIRLFSSAQHWVAPETARS